LDIFNLHILSLVLYKLAWQGLTRSLMFLRLSSDSGRNRFLKQRGYRRGIRYALLMIYPAHYLSRSLLLLGMSIESVGFSKSLTPTQI